MDGGEQTQKHLLVGAVTGVLQAGFSAALAGRIGVMLSAAVLTALPVLLTGGIHLDGFLDTVDARSSFRTREEKLRIMKDPHIGAFAVIGCGVYFVLTYGLMGELVSVGDRPARAPLLALTYVFSRALSGLSVVTLPKARPDGMAAEMAGDAGKTERDVLLLELAAAGTGMLLAGGGRGLLVMLAGGVVFLYCRRVMLREFGGVTGDLAGWFLCLCELVMLAAVAL